MNSIKAVKEKLLKKEISAKELTKSYLDRINKYNKDLNIYLTISEKEALEAAERADKLLSGGQDLPLLGLPIALKDLYSTKGIQTTASSKVLEGYIPPFDATAVEKLKNAGAIILGKLNCDAWAHGSSGENSDYGPARNPWNKEYTPGGSSSGSAAAVTADLAVATTGTDTGGSIRLPASFTNTVGLKPTYGRVSRYGIIAMASSLDSIGHFTKTVEDSAIMLNVTAGKDNKDATTPDVPVPDYTKKINENIKGLKIGVPKEYFIEGLDLEIRKAVEDAINFYKSQGVEIVDISLPHTEYAIETYYIIQPAEVSSNLARYDGIRFGNPRKDFGDEAKRRIMLGTFTLSVGYYDAYYKKAMKVRTLIKQDFDKAFEKVDAIIAPVSPNMPWKLGERIDDPLKMYLADVFAAAVNLSGIPGLSVPCGFSNGLPIGMQILGPQFSEELLFRLGHHYEINHDFYKKEPEL